MMIAGGVVVFLVNLPFTPCLANVLLNDFETQIKEKDKVNKVAVDLLHFQPINNWEIKNHWIVDLTTGDPYCNDSENVVRIKCALAFAGTPFIQIVGLLLNLINRVVKLITLAHFWYGSTSNYVFTARLTEMSKDLLRIVTTPLVLIGFMLSSLYGATIRPYDGRKLYATFERFIYGGSYLHFLGSREELVTFLIAPCFQPAPKRHLFGGDLNQKNAW